MTAVAAKTAETRDPSRLPAGMIAEIDFLRGAFAILVLLGHAIDIARMYALPDLTLPPIKALRPYSGFVWVVGFVVLSGFCIELSCRNLRPQFALGRYAVLRATRLFPLLVAACLICWLAEHVMLGSKFRPRVWTDGIDGAHLFWNLLGAGGFFGTLGSIAPSYTISYELLYYALWGLTRTLMRHRPAGQLVAVNLIGAIGTLALLHSGVLILPPVLADIFKDLILLIYVPWLIGAYLATSIERVAANRMVARLAPFAWLIVLATVVIGWRAFKQPQNSVTAASTVFHIVLALAFGLLLVRGFQRSGLRRPHASDHVLGLLSYPLYVIHGPIIVLTGFLINATGVRLPFGIYLATLMAAALAAAGLLIYLVENPVLRIRRAWLGASDRADASKAVARAKLQKWTT